MTEREILLNWLKKNAVDNHIEISDRLYGYILAQLLKKQSMIEQNNQLLITTQLEEILEQDPVRYKRKLVFWNPKESLSESQICQMFEIDEFEMSFSEETTKESQIICLTYQMEEFKIPIEAELKKLQVEGERIRSRNVKLPYSKKQATLYEFLAEVNMAEDYLYFFTYLELANEMNYFTDLYEILTTQSVSGRLFIKFLKMESEKKQIVLSDELKNLIVTYENNPYLKKKWMAYRKRNHMPEVSWKEAMQLFCRFFDGIWKAYVEDEIFMEEWMPQLGRFM
ncbi:MAG: hypothetical protein K6G01_07870 [Eubacterium sp.]|nr:hypothetical protein [Eubacterium sp.]